MNILQDEVEDEKKKKRYHELIINLPLLVLDLVNTFKKGNYDQNEIPFILWVLLNAKMRIKVLFANRC